MHPCTCSNLFAAHKPPQPAYSTLFIHAYSSFQWLPHTCIYTPHFNGCHIHAYILLISMAATCPCFYGHYLISHGTMVRLPQLPSPLFYVLCSLLCYDTCWHGNHCYIYIVAYSWDTCCVYILYLSQPNSLAFLLVGLLLETYLWQCMH